MSAFKEIAIWAVIAIVLYSAVRKQLSATAQASMPAIL
jgi:hypothetical protein